MDYEKLKEITEQNKPNLLLGMCFVLVFFVGFGTGRFDRDRKKVQQKAQSNYTTSTTKAPETGGAGEGQAAAVLGATQVPAASSTPPSDSACGIKGNISSGGRKIYHVPGGSFYDRTNPEQCFKTEAEAQAAGYVKSSR